MLDDITQNNSLFALKCLDPTIEFFADFGMDLLGQLDGIRGDKKNYEANWPGYKLNAPDLVIGTVRFLCMSSNSLRRRFHELPDSKDSLKIFRVLRVTSDKMAFRPRDLSRNGRKWFLDCVRCIVEASSNANTTEVMAILWAGDEKATIGETALLMMTDSDFSVRLHAASIVPALLKTPLEPLDVFDNVGIKTASTEAFIEWQHTSIITLGQMAESCESLEQDIIFVLLHFTSGCDSRNDPTRVHSLVLSTIARIAKYRKYPAGCANESELLCRWHIHDWLKMWTSAASAETDALACVKGAGKDIASFPYKLCGHTSIAEFYKQHRNSILFEFARKTVMDHYNGAQGFTNYIEQVNRELGRAGQELCDPVSEMRHCYPFLYAQLLCTDDYFTTSALDVFIQRDFGIQNLEEIRDQTREEIVYNLVMSVYPTVRNESAKLTNDEASKLVATRFPSYDKRPSDNIALTVSLCLRRTPVFAQALSTHVIAEIVHDVHAALCGDSNRQAFKIKHLSILLYCLEQLNPSEKQLSPYIFRYVIYICLQNITAEGIEEACVIIIKKACMLDMEENKALNMCSHLQDVISVMVSCVITSKKDRKQTVTLQFLTWLVDLVLHDRQNNGGNQSLLEQIKAFPQEPEFKDLNQKLDNVRQPGARRSSIEPAEFTLCEDTLRRFVQENSGMFAVQLQHLQKFLRSHRSDLCAIAKGSRKLLSQCIWKLIGVCSGVAHTEVKQLASACLGELGPLGSDSIAFSSYGADESNENETNELER